MRHSFRPLAKADNCRMRFFLSLRRGRKNRAAARWRRIDVDKHAQRRPGHRRLSDPREGAVRVRPVRPRQHPVHRRAVRALRATSRPSRCTTRASPASWPTSITACRGQPTATFTSCGPGSANLPISLGNAFLDSVPFLAVTGNVPTSQFNRGAFQELYRHYQADFPSTVRAYCKRCSSRRAARWCRSRCGRRGRPW